MEFIDLKRQYREYKTEIDARMRTVLEHGHFIMGPEIAELETRVDVAGIVRVVHIMR